MLREKAVLTGHTNAVVSVTVTPDGARMITGSFDNTARVWDARTFAELGQLEGHTGTVMSMAVSPDGARIVTAFRDNTARVWDVFPSGQNLVIDAQRAAPRCLTPGQRHRYHLLPNPPRWCEATQRWPYDELTVTREADAHALQHVMAGRAREAITGLEAVIRRRPEVAARLGPALADAHRAVARRVFADVALRKAPAEGLKDALANADKAVALAPEDRSILETRGQIRLALARSFHHR
jgi:hypothetical protein